MSSGHLLLSGDGLGFWVVVFGVRGRKVKSRDCALASDLVGAGRALPVNFALPATHSAALWALSDLPGVHWLLS